VDYYTTEGNRQADDQIRIAQVSYDLGEIGYMEYIQNMALAVQSKLIYLQEIKKMNESVIQLQFLKGH
jgi:cobalt-zinc-cadmium resistance protein CzcA